MTDWSARASAVLQKNPRTPTDTTDETHISSVSSVGREASLPETRGSFVGFVGTHADLPEKTAIPEAIDNRITYLQSIGAIDADDAALVRLRFHAYADEWLMLLDACEAAAKERAR